MRRIGWLVALLAWGLALGAAAVAAGAPEDRRAALAEAVGVPEIIDIMRKEGRMKHFAEGEQERVTAAEPRPGRSLEQAETNAAILRLIDRLPPNQQEVVRLKFQNGFSYKEISRITSLSVSNVGFILHTAVTRLRTDFAALRP